MNLDIETMWPFGTEMAEELLDAITMLAKNRGAGSKSMQRIDSKSFKVYWAGTILRIDIPQEEIDWNL